MNIEHNIVDLYNLGAENNNNNNQIACGLYYESTRFA